MDVSGNITAATAVAAALHRKTVKRISLDNPPPPAENADQFRNLLDSSARDAFSRQWHRLERGLRLNRLRMYVEQIAPQCSFTAEEKSKFFEFLQRAHDAKRLNTHKIVNYIPEEQRIESIRGLEVRRAADGTARWGFVIKKTDGTRRRRKEDDNAQQQQQPSQ